jgi:hypothetical protein
MVLSDAFASGRDTVVTLRPHSDSSLGWPAAWAHLEPERRALSAHE